MQVNPSTAYVRSLIDQVRNQGVEQPGSEPVTVSPKEHLADVMGGGAFSFSLSPAVLLGVFTSRLSKRLGELGEKTAVDAAKAKGNIADVAEYLIDHAETVASKDLNELMSAFSTPSAGFGTDSIWLDLPPATQLSEFMDKSWGPLGNYAASPLKTASYVPENEILNIEGAVRTFRGLQQNMVAGRRESYLQDVAKIFSSDANDPSLRLVERGVSAVISLITTPWARAQRRDRGLDVTSGLSPSEAKPILDVLQNGKPEEQAIARAMLEPLINARNSGPEIRDAIDTAKGQNKSINELTDDFDDKKVLEQLGREFARIKKDSPKGVNESAERLAEVLSAAFGSGDPLGLSSLRGDEDPPVSVDVERLGAALEAYPAGPRSNLKRHLRNAMMLDRHPGVDGHIRSVVFSDNASQAIDAATRMLEALWARGFDAAAFNVADGVLQTMDPESAAAAVENARVNADTAAPGQTEAALPPRALLQMLQARYPSQTQQSLS